MANDVYRSDVSIPGFAGTLGPISNPNSASSCGVCKQSGHVVGRTGATEMESYDSLWNDNHRNLSAATGQPKQQFLLSRMRSDWPELRDSVTHFLGVETQAKCRSFTIPVFCVVGFQFREFGSWYFRGLHARSIQSGIADCIIIAGGNG